MFTSLLSLFYVTGEFHRFLHRGRAQIIALINISRELQRRLKGLAFVVRHRGHKIVPVFPLNNSKGFLCFNFFVGACVKQQLYLGHLT